MPARRTGSKPPLSGQDSQRKSSVHRRFESRELAAWVIGTSLLALLILALALITNPTDAQRAILRFFMAVAASVLSYFLIGHIILKGKTHGFAIAASGGFVLFFLIQFVFDPFPPHPPMVPPSGVIRILLPADGEVVDRTTPLEWETSYPDKNHYVLVSWEGAPTPVVQNPTLVIAGSTWKGSAQIGEAGDASGTRFWLQIVATRAQLQEGALAKPPRDAQYSDRISVIRR